MPLFAFGTSKQGSLLYYTNFNTRLCEIILVGDEKGLAHGLNIKEKLIALEAFHYYCLAGIGQPKKQLIQ